jgi:hypothetical protein
LERRAPYAESPLTTAHDLAVLIASMSVTSSDTINTAINPASLAEYAAHAGVGLSPELAARLEV